LAVDTDTCDGSDVTALRGSEHGRVRPVPDQQAGPVPGRRPGGKLQALLWTVS